MKSAAGERDLSTPDRRASGRALYGLALAVVLALSPWFSAAAVLPQLRVLWHLNSASAAWLTLAVQLGFVAGALLSAAFGLADRAGPRRLMLLGGLLAGAANLGLLLAHGPLSAVLLRALTGAALALVYPPALKAMSAWFVRGRGAALGIMVGALTLGSALPHLVNGLNTSSRTASGTPWQAVIVVTSLLAALGGVLASRIPDGPHPFRSAAFRAGQAWQAFTSPGVRLTTLGYLGHMWELYAMWAWFSAFFAGVLAHGTVTGGAVMGSAAGTVTSGAAYATALVVGVGALGCVLGGILGDRWGRTRLTSLAMLLSGGAALTLALVLPFAPLGVLLGISVFWGFWIIADSAQFSTIVSEIADPAYVGTALTLQLALGFSLTAVSIALVPVIEGLAGWRAVFAALSLGPLLGAYFMRRLGRSPDAAQIAGGRG